MSTNRTVVANSHIPLDFELDILFYTFPCKIYRKNPNRRSSEMNLITKANITFSPQECQKCTIQTNKHKKIARYVSNVTSIFKYINDISF